MKNITTVVQAEKKQEAQQKVEAHKEPIAEDFENSCSLLYIYIYICNTII